MGSILSIRESRALRPLRPGESDPGLIKILLTRQSWQVFVLTLPLGESGSQARRGQIGFALRLEGRVWQATLSQSYSAMAPYSNGNADFVEILNFFICADDAFCDGCDSTQASVVLVRRAHPGNPVSRER